MAIVTELCMLVMSPVKTIAKADNPQRSRFPIFIGARLSNIVRHISSYNYKFAFNNSKENRYDSSHI